jgi:hypothetical protein
MGRRYAAPHPPLTRFFSLCSRELATSSQEGSVLPFTVERGPDQVRVEAIAAELAVSTRISNSYFSRKEEAIVASGTDRADRTRAALSARAASRCAGRVAP